VKLQAKNLSQKGQPRLQLGKSCVMLAVEVVASSRSLLVFRTRSRHTLDFKPIATFDLPLLEFAALEPAATLTRASEDAQCTWVDGISEAAFMRSATACILVQAAYRIVGFGTSVEAAAAAAAGRPRASGEEESVQGRLRVVDLARPNLLRDEAAGLQARAAPLLAQQAGGSGGGSKLTLLRCAAGKAAFVGVRLCDGPAGGAGAPSRTPRRPYGGWLGRCMPSPRGKG
jgi:hypothetical protein